MKQYKLEAVDAINNRTQVTNKVIAFTDHKNFRVIKNRNNATLITAKGKYYLKRSTERIKGAQSVYKGYCGKTLVTVSFKKVVATVLF